jgi:hypothetical protein
VPAAHAAEPYTLYRMRIVLFLLPLLFTAVSRAFAGNEVPILKGPRTCNYYRNISELESSTPSPIGAVNWNAKPVAAWFYFDGNYTVKMKKISNAKRPSGMMHGEFGAINDKSGITLDCSPLTEQSENDDHSGMNRLKCKATTISASPHNSFPQTIYGMCYFPD